MKEIKLTQGQVALVDDKDFEWLSQWKWYVMTNYGHWYAIRNGDLGSIYMHKEIMKPMTDFVVNHIDGNRLNNQKVNLRLCNLTGKAGMQKEARNNTSGYRGVSWHRKFQCWVAKIGLKNETINLGCFPDPKQAALAYNAAALKHFGEFARINLICDSK